MEFEIEDMIECFLRCGRKDLVSVLELIFEELTQVYEGDTTDEDGEEEYVEVEVDDSGFMSLK